MWGAALEADVALWNGPWGDDGLTRQHYANFMSKVAREKSEYAGLPLPMMGESLTIEKSYVMADKQDLLNGLMNIPEEQIFVCKLNEESEQTHIRNTWWSERLRCDVVIWQVGTKFFYGLASAHHHADQQMRTLGCSDAWTLETEFTAMGKLRTLVGHRALRHYILTGSFLETSPRSQVTYMFRRLRPTLAISHRNNQLRILAALCLHPIAYYQGTWAGAMCPTDDVIAHLMLMRGDEKLFWRRANQHQSKRPEAGL